MIDWSIDSLAPSLSKPEIVDYLISSMIWVFYNISASM